MDQKCMPVHLWPVGLQWCQVHSMGKEYAFQQMVLGQLNFQRMKLQFYLTPDTKINSKWVRVRAKTTKLLEENTGEVFHDVGFGRVFLDMIPKHSRKKKRKEKRYICLHQLFASENIIKEVKRHATKGRNYL